MTADEYDIGEGPSPTNRTLSGDTFVVGGDDGNQSIPAAVSSEGFDADRNCETITNWQSRTQDSRRDDSFHVHRGDPL